MIENRNSLVPELSVSNFAKSLEFYCDVLGFKVRYQRSNPDFAYLDYENIQIMIEQIHNSAWITGDLEAPLGKGINFQMQVSDVHPILSQLKSAKIGLYQDIEDNWYDAGNILIGQREFLVQDPDGYLLRFVQLLGEKC